MAISYISRAAVFHRFPQKWGLSVSVKPDTLPLIYIVHVSYFSMQGIK